ncbi:MAG: hypothetical protein K2J61_00690, partial [Clostridia bacterium]|nr:hypothetical protein [Clostridia bacterium]
MLRKARHSLLAFELALLLLALLLFLFLQPALFLALALSLRRACNQRDNRYEVSEPQLQLQAITS